MPSSQSSLSCALCGSKHYIEVSRISAVPIESYWRELGIDFPADFPAFPREFLQLKCVNCGLHSFDPQVVAGTAVYAALGKVDGYYASSKWEFEAALRLLAAYPPEHLLELGCGEGHFLVQAGRFAGRVTGIESNPEAVAAARERNLSIRTHELERLDGPFNAIVSFQVMEHLTNPGEVIRQCVERLSPGGMLIISVPNQDGVMGEMKRDFLNLPPHHVTRWERRCFDYIAEDNGLALENYYVEPLSFELYAAACLERLESVKFSIGRLSKALNAVLQVAHRANLPIGYYQVRQSLHGHTHMGVFRKL